jgi:hypothetical protein
MSEIIFCVRIYFSQLVIVHSAHGAKSPSRNCSDLG